MVQSNETTIIIFTTTTNLKLEFNSTSLSTLNKKGQLNNYSSLLLLPPEQSYAKIINLFYKTEIVNYAENTGEYVYPICPCTLLIGQTILLLGGDKEQYQITEVYPWKNAISKRIGTLPFEFESGRCTQHNGIAYLCFPNSDRNFCQKTLVL